MEHTKKELDYFNIESSFGGNQDWFKDWWMHVGGCAAAAACDSCIQLQKSGLKQNLYPYDIDNLTKKDYIDFAMEMKPFLRPRWEGICRLEIYTSGMSAYLKSINNNSLKIKSMSSDEHIEDAVSAVKKQIDSGFPIPFLLLKHKNHNFKDLLWHWFMLVGYKGFEYEFYVKLATYGGYRYISFNELWKSGYKNNGGMIIYS